MRCGEVAASAVSEFLKFFGQNADGWKSHISYFLNVYRGNPRDGYYFHQLGNDKRTNEMKTKTFVFVVALKIAVFNGSTKGGF